MTSSGHVGASSAMADDVAAGAAALRLGPHLLDLPPAAWTRILASLDAVDLERLAQTCKALKELCRDDRVWEPLCHDVFGVSLDVQQRLAAEGVLLPSSDRQSLPTADWRAFYQSRHRTLSDLSGERLAFMYAEVQARLESGSEYALEELGSMAETLVTLLDAQPDHPPTFYTLAYICYVQNAYSSAHHLLTVALELDPDFARARELLADVDEEIEKLVEREQGLSLAEDLGSDSGSDSDADEDADAESRWRAAPAVAPLLVGTAASPQLQAAVAEVFGRFDRDGDGALSAAELSALVAAVNGQLPPAAAIQALLRNFRSNRSGLLVEGLVEFFRRQSLSDPDETRNDLAKLGYNSALVYIPTALSSA